MDIIQKKTLLYLTFSLGKAARRRGGRRAGGGGGQGGKDRIESETHAKWGAGVTRGGLRVENRRLLLLLLPKSGRRAKGKGRRPFPKGAKGCGSGWRPAPRRGSRVRAPPPSVQAASA